MFTVNNRMDLQVGMYAGSGIPGRFPRQTHRKLREIPEILSESSFSLHEAGVDFLKKVRVYVSRSICFNDLFEHCLQLPQGSASVSQCFRINFSVKKCEDSKVQLNLSNFVGEILGVPEPQFSPVSLRIVYPGRRVERRGRRTPRIALFPINIKIHRKARPREIPTRCDESHRHLYSLSKMST